MEIESITHENLLPYLKSEKYLLYDVLPISKHRGISHSNNPKAKSDDVVLINIYENNILIAYLGLLPDDLHTEKEIFHVGWLSCMWVNPNSRGKGLAKKLLKTAWEKWDTHLMVTEFTTPAGALYEKTGYFNLLLSRQSLKCYNRLNLAIFLPNKNKRWSSFYLPLKGIDSFFNCFLWTKKLFLRNKKKLDILVVETKKIDAVAINFIERFQQKELTKKTEHYFNWLSDYPWLLNSKEAKEDQARYFFSSYSEKFEIIFLKIFNKQNLVALVVFSIKKDAAKVPFVYFDETDEDLAQQISFEIFKFVDSKKISTIHLSNESLLKYFSKNKRRFFLIRKLKKQYIVSKNIHSFLEDSPIYLQDGDGDAAFT